MVNIQYLEGKNNFDNFLLNNKNEILLLIFSASWCGPCQAFKKYLSVPESDILYPGLQAVCLDTDMESNEELCDFYEIASLPTYFFVYLDNDNLLDNFIARGSVTNLKAEIISDIHLEKTNFTFYGLSGTRTPDITTGVWDHKTTKPHFDFYPTSPP